MKKGEKASLVVFWKRLDGSDNPDKADGLDDPSDGNRPIRKEKHTLTPVSQIQYLLRYYNVFNSDQCEDLKHPRLEKLDLEKIEIEPGGPLKRAMEIVEEMKDPPKIEEGGTAAFYRPSQDKVQIPAKSLFAAEESYYSTLFHELVHSTGHEKRLSRKGVMEVASFGDQTYSQEELVAEIGAAFLSATAGISNTSLTENSAAYIQSWLEALKSDNKMVVVAASQAQKAADWILGTEQ